MGNFKSNSYTVRVHFLLLPIILALDFPLRSMYYFGLGNSVYLAKLDGNCVEEVTPRLEQLAGYRRRLTRVIDVSRFYWSCKSGSILWFLVANNDNGPFPMRNIAPKQTQKCLPIVREYKIE